MRSLDVTPGSPILVRGPNWVGDGVMALPFYRALHRSFPENPLTILTRSQSFDVTRLSPHADGWLLEDRGKDRGLLGNLRIARRLADREFGAAFLLPGSFSSALLPWLARIPIRVGYARDLRSPLLTHPVPWDSGARTLHRASAYLHLLRSVGLEIPEPVTEALRVPEEDQLEAARMLKQCSGSTEEEAWIGIAPGAVGESRRWPVERFAEVAEGLSRRLGSRVLILGGAGDRSAAKQVSKRLGDQCVDFCGRGPLRLLLPMIERCRVLVANDSGAAHVAGLTTTPTVVLFGAGNEAITRPLSTSVRVLRRTLECTPCESNRCARGDLACLTGIEADEVLDLAASIARPID